MRRVLSVEEAARRGARREDGSRVAPPAPAPAPAPVDLLAPLQETLKKLAAPPKVDTAPLADEMGRLAAVVRVTLQSQSEALAQLAKGQQAPSGDETWEFEVVSRDSNGRIAKLRVSRVQDSV